MYGEVPLSPVVFAACDSKYFLEHGQAFVYSATDNHFCCHIHIINPSEEALALAGIIRATSKTRTTYTFEDKDFKDWPADAVRTYYACSRFLVLPTILRYAGKVMVLDIDCMVMKPFAFPSTPCGYFPRDPLPGTTGWEAEGTRVAAGAVYLDSAAMDVAVRVAEYIKTSEMKWFADQVALSVIFRKVPDNHITKFDGQFMDWEFIEGTAIWTGKGPRKYNNPKYVSEKESYKLRIGNVNNVLLKPRLDIPFKKFGLEKRNDAPLPEIRRHWENFANNVDADLTIEMPRWTFNSCVEDYFPDGTKFLVPHVEKHNWGGGENTKFYMQTVFPWLFTIDHQGWGGGAAFVDTFDFPANYTADAFDHMRKITNGKSKFPQPENTAFELTGDFIFIPLQLPHDETIMYHSDISVAEFVEAVCKWADASPDAPTAVFKGHPVNLAAMLPLKEIISKYTNVKYITDYSIHDLIPKAKATYLINSGVGQEAMLHDAIVVGFGRSEYEGAIINGGIDDLDDAWNMVKRINKDHMKNIYRAWYAWYLNDITYDSRKGVELWKS